MWELTINIIISNETIINEIPCKKFPIYSLKGALSGLRHILATESSLKMMKNVFHFTLKALFVLKIFKFLF